MPKSRSHVHALRTFIGEEDSASLIKLLNSDAEGELVELLECAEDLREAASQKPLSKDKRQQVKLYASRINSILENFQFRPSVGAIRDDCWLIEWESGNTYWREAAAVLILLDLAEQGLIHRVRTCANPKCQRWFYARFDHQRFDSEKCQQENYRSDPTWRQRRREYMKKLRLLHKRRG